jgi:hypothetical protein
MAVVNLNSIKNWFRTSFIPTQEQFWDVFDSFRHKSEKIPAADVEGIDALLLAKADKVVFEDHLTNRNAHAALFDEKLDTTVFENHQIDLNAHEALFAEKENKNNKGVAGGYAPLDEFTKLAIEYLNVVNDLVTGGATSLLTAEQGKLLQNQINTINVLLASDNVNLDNVQELVDAIETIQMSLSSILVNNLTTGGTTKALTAEMGKTLKGLVDSLTVIVNGKEPAITGGAAGQYYDHNKTWQTIPVVDITGKQDIANQVEVLTSQNAQASWHGKTVFFQANVTITIPATGLPSGYTFEGVTEPACSVSWAITAPKVWALGTPAATPEKSIFTLMQLMSNSNKIYLFGL